MTCPMNEQAVAQLELFITICKTKPEILYTPELEFFKNYLLSLGAVLPPAPTKPTQESESPKCHKPETGATETPKMSDEEELEAPTFDMEGCVDPDEPDPNQFLGDINAEPSEEDTDKADELRREAVKEFQEGNIDKAIEKYTEAIKLNPTHALLYAKRGQAYLQQTKPNACIKDCTHALLLNPDSAAAYKFRGRAYRLIADWEKAAADLRQACNIDFDEQADEWLREVTPNARNLEQYKLAVDRKKAEAELREKQERIRKAREANAKAAAENATQQEDIPTGGPGAGPGGADFFQFLKDPEVMEAFKDPEIQAAFADISQNPANILKYQSNPKIASVINKLASKMGGAGGMPGMPPGMAGMGGGMPGMGGGMPGGFGNMFGPNGDDVGLD